MEIKLDKIDDTAVITLLREHLADMHATSPPESVHALDLDGLRDPAVTFWVGWEGEAAIGCVALKELDPVHGEIKSMRTAAQARKRGVGSQLLEHVIGEAARRGYTRLSLETGSQAFFEPARRLYAKFGFEECYPFADYTLDPNSVFMTRDM